MSGSHILDPQIQLFLSVITSPKSTFFLKYDLFLIQLGQIFPKSEQKVGTCVKMRKKKVFRDNWSHPLDAQYYHHLEVILQL